MDKQTLEQLIQYIQASTTESLTNVEELTNLILERHKTKLDTHLVEFQSLLQQYSAETAAKLMLLYMKVDAPLVAPKPSKVSQVAKEFGKQNTDMKLTLGVLSIFTCLLIPVWVISATYDYQVRLQYDLAVQQCKHDRKLFGFTCF